MKKDSRTLKEFASQFAPSEIYIISKIHNYSHTSSTEAVLVANASHQMCASAAAIRNSTSQALNALDRVKSNA